MNELIVKILQNVGLCLVSSNAFIPMSLMLSQSFLSHCILLFLEEAVSFHHGQKPATKYNVGVSVTLLEANKEHIRKMFNKVELSVSSYDTAWVAMVPCASSVQTAQFPQCVNWLLNNQLPDGSWGLHDRHGLLMKDALLSTLASVLALKQWGVGERQIIKGLEFLASNSSCATDEKQHSTIGFDIIFSGMIERAKYLDLNLPLRQSDVDAVLCRRNMELERCFGSLSEGSRAYLSYVSEGIARSQDWQMVMKYQRKDGSILSSPSATAAALMNLQNYDCLHYINSLLEKSVDAVPAVYPMEVYTRLHLIDSVEKLGIHRHFEDEIGCELGDIYRCWLNGEEEIFQDTTTLAMAFRILRSHGYTVSSDPLSRFAEEADFCNTLEGYLMDTGAVLELYKASQMIIYDDEIVLVKLHSWTSRLLKQRLSGDPLCADRLEKNVRLEVKLALRFPYCVNVEQYVKRKNIEHYNSDNKRIRKSACRSINIKSKVLLDVAVEDFNQSQSLHQQELKHLQRWFIEKRFDRLKFARQKKLVLVYLSGVAALPAPEQSDARITWVKNAVLTYLTDDFYDAWCSMEEYDNLLELMEKWVADVAVGCCDVDVAVDCCSENVEIIFSALRTTICETGDRAFKWQGRNVTAHVAEIWLDLLKSEYKEAVWAATKTVPRMDEYMANGFVSFALGPIVLPALYFIGPKLSEDAIRSRELHDLFEVMSTCGRLMNDLLGFKSKRDMEQEKINAVVVLMIHGGICQEEAINSMQDLLESKMKELLRHVLGENSSNSEIPIACRDLFWKMITVLHLFYMDEDGFTSNSNSRMMHAVKDLLERPIALNNEQGAYLPEMMHKYN